MRLISCHIENFGKWSDKNIDFSEGINSFYMNNGEGKTTLAVFIKAMFYGLKGYTETTKDFVERRHFAPFSRVDFGGNIIFEHNGNEYRIERSFHEKSKARDTVSVFCNGSLSEELCTDNVGELFFSLDEESFERTLFVTADDMELCATSGISASLNDYGEGSIDVKKADALLLSGIKKYKSLKGNSSGLINESEKKIKQYRKEIENFEKIDAALGAKYAQRSKMTSRIAELESKASDLRDTALVLQKWQNYDVYASAQKRAQEEIDAINSKYPKGIPSDSKTEAAQKALNDFNKASERLSVTYFGTEKQERLNELNDVFENGEPSEDELLEMRKQDEKIREYEARLKAFEGVIKSEKDSEILSRFGGGIPSDETLFHVSELEADYRKKSARLTEGSSEPSEAAEVSAGFRERNKLLKTVALAGGAAIAVGAALAFAWSFPVGVIVAVLGAVTLVGVGFAYIVGRMNDIEKGRAQEKHSLVDIQLDIKNAESELGKALALLGYANGDALSELARMRSDIERYGELKESEKKRKDDISRLTLSRDETLESLKKELSKYPLDLSNVGYAIRRLEQIKDERRMLADARAKSDEARKNDVDLLCRLNTELDEFFASYRDSAPDDSQAELDAVKSDTLKLSRYKNELNKAKLEADEYMEKEGLSARPEPVSCDVSEIDGELSERRRELSALDGQISDDEECTSKLLELRAALAREEEALEEYKRRHKLLVDCREILRLSDIRLTERYIAPVKKSFNKYANAIKESLGENISLDRELNVNFEKNGIIRHSKHLSAGQRAVWALCLRLAFIDELFDADTPFIVLDDPFLALDADNMSGVARLLQALSNERQLLYFTCHESRLITK